MLTKKPGKIIKMAVRNLFKKPATISYPNGTMQIAEKYRGRIIYDAINCTGCGLCARDCPAGALSIVNEGTKEDRKMKAVLNMGHCIFCCQCVDSCKKNCISFTREIELSTVDKDELKVQL
ncbi:MAG: 4Fe-4S binding protein [Thermoclostridium sp.]|nr:4Fe-4S binding protein [Thermoclostridium sp.]